MPNKKQLLFKGTFFGKMRVNWKTPKSFNPDEWKHVRIKHKDHPEELDAYISAMTAPETWVVMTHPFLKKAKGWMMDYGSYKTYTDRGIGVLMLDFNGFGGSEDIGFDFKDDVLSASLWLKQNYPDATQLLHGVSFGAGHGLVALEKDEHLFKGAILENPFPSITHYYRNKPLLYIFLRFMMLFFPWEKQNRPIASAAKTKNIKKLLWIFATEDSLVDEHSRNEFLNQSNTDKDVWLAKSEHNEAFKNDPVGYAQAIENYLLELGVLEEQFEL